MMNTVVEVHVRAARRTVQRRIPFGEPGRGVTCRVVLADVCLGLDNDPGGPTGRGVVHEDGPNDGVEHLERGTREEGARQPGHCARWIRSMATVAARRTRASRS